MTEEVLKAVEPMPNESVIDLADMSDSTPKKRKVEAIDRSSVAPSESGVSDKVVEKGKKSAKRPKKTEEEKEAAKILKEQRLAQKEQRAAEKEQKTAEKEQKAAEKEAEAKAKQAERDAKQAEKDAKAAEKAQQAALRAEREKEKAEAMEKLQRAKQKQANVMASFFGKKKENSASPVKSLISRSSPAGPSRTESPERQPSPEKTGTDYERTFKGPIIRPNARWADVDPWPKEGSSSKEIDQEELASWSQSGAPAVRNWSSRDFVRDHLSKHCIRAFKRRRLPQGLKTAPPAATVGEVWAEYLKSDNPRAVLDQLKDDERYPWKTLSFHHENRPPYRGTWTKRSVCVGPRTPFGQDPTIDYAYDSDAEWVDDEGDNVDAGSAADEDEEEEEEDDDDGESEGEFDDWLDDSRDAVKKKIAKRKFVEIVPSWSGPLWETQLGEGTPGMEDYRIRCLNDTPLHSIDPFTWVSASPEQRYKAEYALFAADNGNNVKCLIRSKRIASKKVVTKEEQDTPTAKPSDPSAIPVPGPDTTTPPASAARSRAPAGPPPFPTLYTPQFLEIVSGSTQSEAELLAALKAALPFATKATLKAKLKDTATKVGAKKDIKWVLKSAQKGECKPDSSALAPASEVM